MATKKSAKNQEDTFDGIMVDVSGIDKSLTERAKRFVFWFSFPGSDCFQNKTRSAIKAGYARKNAVSSGYKLCQNPKVKQEIERLSKELLSEKIEALYNRHIDALEQRVFFDPAEFVDAHEFKRINDIAPEKRIVIDQVEIKDIKGEKVMAYTFGNRRAAMAEIRQLHEKMNPIGEENYDVEETMRIIHSMEKNEVYIETRKRNDGIIKQAIAAGGFVQQPANIVEEP